METSDARKRHNEAVETAIAHSRLREQQAEVQKRFNTREDEREPVSFCGTPELEAKWCEDFPEPEWHKSWGVQTVEGLPPVKGCTDTPCGECAGPVETPYDAVHQPEHYTHSRIEVWDAIDAWGLGYRLGNVIKYVARADRKGNPVQDLMKARAYLDREIATRQQDARDW